MPENLHQVRLYGAKTGDFQTVQAWADARGMIFDETVAGPEGFICEHYDEHGEADPLAVAWLYPTAGIGIAWIDHLITRPGLSPAQATEAISHILNACKMRARDYDCGLVIAHTSPILAERAEKLGWQVQNTNLVRIACRTEK